MFTGIVTDVGRVRSVTPGGITRLEIETVYDPAGIDIGASIACSGPCLTVVERGGEAGAAWFAVEVSQETLDCTTIGRWQVGSRVNLERALKIGDELGGHIVTGHIDGLADVVDRRPDGDSIRFTFEASPELARFIAPKGSVALDGVSLTVNEVDATRFGVNIIPHTLNETSLADLWPTQAVNLEVDLMARYAARLLTAG